MMRVKSFIRNMSQWFLLMILVPTLLLTGWLYSVMVRDSYESAVEDNYTLLNVMAENIHSNQQMVENMLETLATDERVTALLGGVRFSDYDYVATQKELIEESLASIRNLLSGLDARITLYPKNVRVPTTYWWILPIWEAEESEDYHRFLNLGSIDGWVGSAMMYPIATTVNPADNARMFCYYRKVFSQVGGWSGVLKCGVSERAMFSSIDLSAMDGSIFVMQDGQAIYGSAPKESVVQLVDVSLTEQHIGGQLCLVKPLEELGVSLVMCLPYREVLAEAFMSALAPALISLGSCLFLLVVTRVYLKNIQRRLDQALVFADQAKQGKQNIRFPDPGSDEIGRLIDTFNVLLGQLELSAQRRLDHEKAEKRALHLALQYQMNPHFLFNSLNWLQMSAEMGLERERLAEGIVMLGRLLRYNLDRSFTATLQEEIENTRTYIRLINMRKRDLVSLDVQVEEINPDQSVLRFLFQPLCENAIQYGMVGNNRLNIRIRGEIQGDMIAMTVENDGAGIPEARMEEIQRNIERETGEGIGLANTAARLRLYYGEDARLWITSRQNRVQVELRFRQNLVEIGE